MIEQACGLEKVFFAAKKLSKSAIVLLFASIENLFKKSENLKKMLFSKGSKFL